MAQEVSYYPNILAWLIKQLESNFKGLGKSYTVLGGIGEIRQGLQKLINTQQLTSKQIENFYNAVPPLNLDVFIVVANAQGDFELIICEVKDKSSVGLTELSQLIGYCLIADAEFGLLTNIDGDVSARLHTLISTEPDLTHIERQRQGNPATHKLGVMKWDSSANRLMPTRLGGFKGIPELCKLVAQNLG